MFNKILIKSGSNNIEQILSITDVVDMMFFFNEVHVVISQFELNQLLTSFGEDIFYELITSKRLFVHPCDQHIGCVKDKELHSVGLFRHDFSSFDELLFNFHKKKVDNHNENKKFANRFSKILSEYRYPNEINDRLYKDIENDDLLSKATKVFIKQYYPNYRNIEDIHIKAEPFTQSLPINMQFYKIIGNLRINELSHIHQENGYPGNFGYSTILISLGETLLDCYLASELQAEMKTNQKWSEVYKLRINEYLKQAEKTQENIDHFREMTAFEYFSPGEAFAKGCITAKDLLYDLNSSDSIKFREWLSKIPNGPISSELYKQIKNQNSNKKWVKTVRTMTQIIAGLIPIPGVSIVTTCLDAFLVDKIVNGWQPSLFVEKIMTKEQFKK